VASFEVELVATPELGLQLAGTEREGEHEYKPLDQGYYTTNLSAVVIQIERN
jgi:hypothetical protein